MRFRRGRKSFGLIAVLSCVLTATVAFAAYTGYNYIKGTVTVEGSPFKMVFADKDGTPYEDGGTIPNAEAKTEGSAVASDLTVSAFTEDAFTDDGGRTWRGPRSTISDFTVTLKEVGDSVTYDFKIKNVGGATAYLNVAQITYFPLPSDGAGNKVSGLLYSLTLNGKDDSGNSPDLVLKAQDGHGPIYDADGLYGEVVPDISVPPGEAVDVTLTVEATDARLFSAYDTGKDGYGATITLGTVQIGWSAVPPKTSGT